MPKKPTSARSAPPKGDLQHKGEERYTADQLAEALRLNRGNASAAARVLECHPDTIRNYCARYPEVQKARESGGEVRLDLAEAALDRAVTKGEGWAVCFLLKTQGKRRGYIERQESISLTVSPKDMTDAQLERLANGEDPVAVIARA